SPTVTFETCLQRIDQDQGGRKIPRSTRNEIQKGRLRCESAHFVTERRSGRAFYRLLILRVPLTGLPAPSTLIVVSFVNAFLNQFLRDVFLIFRAHGRNFLARRHKWHFPVATRFLSRRGLL